MTEKTRIDMVFTSMFNRKEIREINLITAVTDLGTRVYQSHFWQSFRSAPRACAT